MITHKNLLTVEKPGRYTGGEVNMVQKGGDLTRFALCFPDVYEIGMSNLGMMILYYFMNRREDVYCERAFMPWLDMYTFMKTENEPLFALETKDPLAKFDFIGFSLSYEMSYTNVLAMLELAGLPLYAKERDENAPIICAGGPCVMNPEPMADFIDFFYIGDGEASLDAVLDVYGELRKNGYTKSEFLSKIAQIDGIYVPSLYEVEYNDDGTLKAFLPSGEAPAVVKRAFAPCLDYYPEKMLVPLIEVTHNRAVLEIARGCMRGCRFCQAGFIYRPVRERSKGQLKQQARKLLDSTGHEEISLLSLSSCDYEGFEELVDDLLEITEPQMVNISLPSTRLDAVSSLAKIQKVRKSSLTVAPEAGSQRLRDIINKNLSEEEILSGVAKAFEAGFDKLKLYFMAGLPFEDEDDLDAIGELCRKIVDEYYKLPLEKRRRAVSISVSTACFVPKPFTPFQWAAQQSPQVFALEQRTLKDDINNRRITYRYHDAKGAYIEGALARGDRRLGQVIETAYKNGAIYDGWSEFFKYDFWKTAFDETGVDLDFFTSRERNINEIFPWDFIDIGVSKAFLLGEWEKAGEAETTPNCRELCTNCGVGCK